MAFSQATLVQRVRNLIGDNPWATTGTAATSSSVIAVPDGTKWDEAATGEFEDTGEQFWVQSVSANNLTAIRGFNGTTAAAHTAGGILIYRDPAFSYKQITDACELAMQGLWPYCYKKVTAIVTPIASQPYKWYDLAADALALIHVVQVSTSSTPSRLYGYGTKGSGLSIAFANNLPTSLVPSGTGVQFPRGFVNTTDTVQVDYAAKLTTTLSTGSYSDLSDGILADIIAYAAASRLVIASDVPRATQEDISMGDSSVQVGMRSSVGRQLYQQYIMLRNQYWDELRRTMPLAGSAPGGNRTSYAAGYGTYAGSGPYP